MKKIGLLNGPNLDRLGKREPEVYGSVSLAEIEEKMKVKATACDCEVDAFQSNHEGSIVDFIQESTPSADGVAINPGALTHYGVSLRDALQDSKLPFVEVHISNIHAREEFRHRSVLVDIAAGQIAGLGLNGYLYALDYLAGILKSS